MLHLPPTGSLPAELGTQKHITSSISISSAVLAWVPPAAPQMPGHQYHPAKSFTAVCLNTLSKRPCQDGAVTRLKDTISGGSWGIKAEWINMLSHLFP